MTQQISDRRDVDFVLHEQINAADLCRHDVFREFNKKTIDMIVTEARNLALKAILPLQKISDAGCVFENGIVKVPEELHQVHKLYCEGGWPAMSDNPEWGGQGMPHVVTAAANEFFYGACNSYMLYNLLTHGAAKLVETIGTERQKALCLKNLYSGKWGGTMLLTEPMAGSDVGALTTVAIPRGDGTYSIKGDKIFISSGENNLVENIIHPTLARIEGAPEGTRGISLFLVPKFRINDDGSLGEFNNVVCTGIEEKMGLHGNATCSLNLGGKGETIGTLLGPEHKGMSAMFLMMNEARQMVGLQGFANASCSYMHALGYARERIQSKGLADPPGSAPVSIIHHPDVRRMLMTMRAYVNGMRSLVYYANYLFDLAATATTDEEKAGYKGMIDIFTPIVKGFITDKAFEVCSLGVQVYGGYGFIEEFPVAQLLRDCRIFQIYEGTNGIQSIDLLNRKMELNNGKPFQAVLDLMKKTLTEAKATAGLGNMAANFEAVYSRYLDVASTIKTLAVSDKVLNAYAFSHPFLEATGDVAVAWMLLWRAVVAAPKCNKKGKDQDFYLGQVKVAQFFINAILPATNGRLEAISHADGAAIEMPDAGFGA